MTRVRLLCRRVAACAIAVPVMLAAGGCNTINGLVGGFERDVDAAVAVVDRLGAQLLPAERTTAYRPALDHFEYPHPTPAGRRTRFGQPGR